MLLNPKTLKHTITCVHTAPDPIDAIRITETNDWRTTTYGCGHTVLHVAEYLDIATSDATYYLNAIDLNLTLKHLGNIPFNILQATTNLTYEIIHPTATFTITNEDNAHSRAQFTVIDSLLEAADNLTYDVPRTIPMVNSTYLAAASKAITQLAGPKATCNILALDMYHPLYLMYKSSTLHITALIMPLIA